MTEETMQSGFTDAPSWRPLNGTAVALFAFEGKGPNQITLAVRDTVEIKEVSRGNHWYRGENTRDHKLGIFPAAYVRMEGNKFQASVMSTDHEVEKIDGVLVEWGAELKESYREGRFVEFYALRDQIVTLINARRKVTNPQINDVEKKTLLKRVLEKIDEMKRVMGLEMVVKNSDGEPATETNTGINELLDMHVALALRDRLNIEQEDEKQSKDSVNVKSASSIPIASTSRYRRLRKKREAATDASTSSTHKSFPPDKQPYQIIVDYKTLITKVQEETSIYFTLYSKKDKVFMETFVVNLTSQGMVEETKIGKQQCIFLDVLQSEMKDLYLFCRLVRTGKLQDDSKSKDKSSSSKSSKSSLASSSNNSAGSSSSASSSGGAAKKDLVRRPFAVGVLALTDNVFAAKGDSTIPLYHWKGSEEVQFATLHESVVRADNGVFESLGPNASVVIAVNRYPLEQSSFRKEYPELSESASECRKLVLPDVIDVGDSRNDLYITLDSAELPDLPSGVGAEITVTPRLDRGPLLPNSMILASGEKPRTLFKSWVVLNSSSPVWKEMLRLSIPANQYKEAHLNFTITLKETKDTSKQKKGQTEREAFGFGFIKLTNAAGAVLSSGEHSIPVYRNPAKTVDDLTFYLKENSLDTLARKGNRLILRAQLSSAILTQDENLLKLINWKDHQNDLENLVKKVTYTSHMDILKFLREIFDAMFAILEFKTDLALQVYDALVFIIGILVDEKASAASNYRSVLDSYIVHHFQGRTAHKTLMKCLQFYLCKLDSASHAKFIRDSMRALDYLFRFIVTSNIMGQQAGDTTEADREEFLTNLMAVLEHFNQLMAHSSPALIGAKTIALKNFSAMLHELSKIFEISEIAKIACTFLMSIPHGEGMKQLNMEKLNLVHELVSGAFYLTTEARAELMPTVVHLLALHMEKSNEELVQCVDILGTLLDTIQFKFAVDVQPLCVWELVPLVQQLTVAVCSYPHDNFDFLKVVACAVSFYSMMVDYYNTPEPYVFNQYLGYAEDPEDFLKTVLTMADTMLSRGFPSNWFVLQMFSYHTLYRVARALAPHLTLSFSETVWKTFLGVLIRLMTAPSLQIERLPQNKQDTLAEKYVNLRSELRQLFEQMWANVVTASSPLVESLLIYLVDPSIDLLMAEAPMLRDLGLSIYLQLLRRDFELHQSIEGVLSKTTDAIHKLIDLDDDTLLRQVFLPALEKEFSSSETESFKVQGFDFMKDLNQQIELMNALSQLPTDPAYDDERVNATMRLMNYLREKNKLEAFVRNVHLLIMQQLSSNNYAEAALTLVLHSSLLNWDDAPLEPLQISSFLPMPRETSASRKERLTRAAVDFFDKAKEWERAITELRPLEDYYERTYRFRDLADLLQTRATMTRNISETERFFPEYFRVGYYGKGFASSISNEEFIYRGLELERLSDFTERIRARFPSSELLKSTEKPGPDITESSGQYLLITPVNPSSEAAMNRQPLDQTGLPAFVRKYAKYSNVKVFLYSKTFKKSAVKGVNEFADLWIRKIFMVTNDPFPSYSRSSRVIQVVEMETSPIANAVEAITAKTEELHDFIGKHSGQARINLNPFTMALNGVIDAAVNGGINNYKMAFLTNEFASANPDLETKVEELRAALRNQMQVLQAGVVLHKTLVATEMQGLQDHMETALEKLKNQIQEVLSTATPVETTN